MKINTKNLDLAMANACLSVDELSKLSGVNITTLSRIRRGSQEPMPKTIGKLARALECKAEELIED
jgi:transcriptional regulator with XRE-family HTH domain